MAKDESTYGFNKDDATSLIASINSPATSYSEGGSSTGLAARVFETPGGGITARSGTTLGTGTCTHFRIAGGVLATSGDTYVVRNLGTEAVPGNIYIQAVRIEGIWVANWEQCE
jgi:hypothetical protein